MNWWNELTNRKKYILLGFGCVVVIMLLIIPSAISSYVGSEKSAALNQASEQYIASITAEQSRNARNALESRTASITASDNAKSIAASTYKESEAARKQRVKEEAKASFRVRSVKTSKPNSADGVSLGISWLNLSDKVIKYVDFEVIAYNAVDDPVSCEIRRKSYYQAKETGHFSKGQGRGDGFAFDCAWYNKNITYAKISYIDIQYMDGTNLFIDEDNVPEVIY